MTQPTPTAPNVAPLQPEDTALRSKYDYAELFRKRDKIKASVFMAPNAAFLGPVMSGCEFYWSTEIDTACTDGLRIWWNPDFFLGHSEQFNKWIMIHETDHVARLHMLRMDWRDGTVWNWATDLRINADAHRNGYRWEGEGFHPWFKPEWDSPKLLAEEELYDKLINEGWDLGPNVWGHAPEFQRPNGEDLQKQINNVQRGISNAKAEHKPEDIPGNLETMLDHFLAPILPWEQLLARWFQERKRHRRSWRRPKRRYLNQGLYLPSKSGDEGELSHLVYLQDVSGSITNAEIIRFNSELKHVWDQFKPKKMTVVEFDAKIQKVYEFKRGDEFHQIEIIGRGGNDMNCVADFLDNLAEPATAAVIFADMQFAPMRPLKDSIPVLWINSGFDCQPPYGEIIKIPIDHSLNRRMR